MQTEDQSWTRAVRILREKKLTITAMESCTGGAIANEITNISGASEIIKESYVTYCNEAKIKQGVPAEAIEKYSVYSRETAIEMAKAAKIRAEADIAIGVTGQLGRVDPSNPDVNVNRVWYAIVDVNNDIHIHTIDVPSDERKNQKLFVTNDILKELSSIIQ